MITTKVTHALKAWKNHAHETPVMMMNTKVVIFPKDVQVHKKQGPGVSEGTAAHSLCDSRNKLC